MLAGWRTAAAHECQPQAGPQHLHGADDDLVQRVLKFAASADAHVEEVRVPGVQACRQRLHGGCSHHWTGRTLPQPAGQPAGAQRQALHGPMSAGGHSTRALMMQPA